MRMGRWRSIISRSSELLAGSSSASISHVKLVSLQSIFPAVLEFYLFHALCCLLPVRAFLYITICSCGPNHTILVHLCAQVLLAVYLLYNCSVFWWPWFDQSWYFIIHRHQTCTIICIRSYALYTHLYAQVFFGRGWVLSDPLLSKELVETETFVPYRLVPRAPCVGEIQDTLSAMNHRLCSHFDWPWVSTSVPTVTARLLQSEGKV